MVRLITDEGTFEYTDLVELIHEYDKNTLDMNVPCESTMINKLIDNDGYEYVINCAFSEFIGDLIIYHNLILREIPKRLLKDYVYYEVKIKE